MLGVAQPKDRAAAAEVLRTCLANESVTLARAQAEKPALAPAAPVPRVHLQDWAMRTGVVKAVDDLEVKGRHDQARANPYKNKIYNIPMKE